ncbi:MAG TPA: hypothetical protein VHP33_24000 [Polyangiaceae bacterium]|nr:hypothetical protein [Polyangiaceae bacterium]
MDPSSGTTIWSIIMWWAGLAGAAGPAPNAAERGYSLEYQAAKGCPDSSVLAQAIETRTPSAQQAPVNRAAVQLRVELRDDGTSTLWLQLPQGSSRREFPKADCADTITTIAVIASMVLEADVSERSATAQSVMERVDPASAPPQPGPPSAVSEPTLVAPAAPALSDPAPLGVNKDAPLSDSSRLHVALAAGLLVESAVAEGAAFGASAGITGWLEPARPSVWVPRVQAEVLATVPANVQADQGDVELQLTAARLHLCPLRFTVGERLQLVPCLTADAGWLRAEGAGATLNPRRASMPWLALGGTARAQLALGRVVSLESWLGLRGLTRADSFVFSPNVPAYQVPHWSLGAGLGVSAALP